MLASLDGWADDANAYSTIIQSLLIPSRVQSRPPMRSIQSHMPFLLAHHAHQDTSYHACILSPYTLQRINSPNPTIVPSHRRVELYLPHPIEYPLIKTYTLHPTPPKSISYRIHYSLTHRSATQTNR